MPPAVRAVPPETLKKWSRPVVPPSNNNLSEISVLNSDSQPSIAPLATQKDSQSKNSSFQPTSLSPDSSHANSSSTLAEDPHRAIGAAPPLERLKKWSRPVAPPSNIKLSEISALKSDPRPSIVPLAAQKFKNNASQPTSWSPDSHHVNSSPTLAETPAEHPSRVALPPETLKKWSQPVLSSILNSDSRPSIASLAAQKVSQPKNELISLSLNSEHTNSLPTLAETSAEHPNTAIHAAPPSVTLNKWSRPSNSILSQIPALNSNSQLSMAPLAAQKVSQPENKPTSLPPDYDHAYFSPTLVETLAEHPNRTVSAAPPPESLKKWSRPVAPPSNNILPQIHALNSNSQLSMAPLAAQKVLQPTSLSSDSGHANSSPTLVETPAEHPNRVIRAVPAPETLKKWLRPATPPPNSKLSQKSVPNSDSQPSIAPLAQKVSWRTSLSPDSDHANASRTLAKTPVENRSRAIRAAPYEALNRSRPVAPSSNSKLSFLNSDPQRSKASLMARKFLRRKNNVSQRTSLLPDSDRANQSLEETSLSQTPHRLEFGSSLDTEDPDDEFVDKRLRPDAHRRNQKGYFEGKGRFERVSSKVLLLQSANNLISKKKASSVPKLIEARRMDVFIPSTISVATLATLLNVKLGT